MGLEPGSRALDTHALTTMPMWLPFPLPPIGKVPFYPQRQSVYIATELISLLQEGYKKSSCKIPKTLMLRSNQH